MNAKTITIFDHILSRRSWLFWVNYQIRPREYLIYDRELRDRLFDTAVRIESYEYEGAIKEYLVLISGLKSGFFAMAAFTTRELAKAFVDLMKWRRQR